MARPPKGFRGVFLWVPQPDAAGVPIPAAHVAGALAAITSPAGSMPAPWVGLVVLGRWLGSKPGDGGWGIDGVEADHDGFVVRMDSGRLVVDVRKPGSATLAAGPYGDLLTIPVADSVTVTWDGQAPTWLPSVRAGEAYDMRGVAAKWPRRKAPGQRATPAVPVPAVAFSVWNARPLAGG